jgi:hypothetical protein
MLLKGDEGVQNLEGGWQKMAIIFRYFLRYFSSAPRTDLSRFRGTFHSFDPVGFAIFAIPAAAAGRANGRCAPQHIFAIETILNITATTSAEIFAALFRLVSAGASLHSVHMLRP